jgi:hypothetical protein
VRVRTAIDKGDLAFLLRNAKELPAIGDSRLESLSFAQAEPREPGGTLYFLRPCVSSIDSCADHSRLRISESYRCISRSQKTASPGETTLAIVRAGGALALPARGGSVS